MNNWLARNIKHGLEWNCDSAKIAINKNSDNLSIYIYPKSERPNYAPQIAFHIVHMYGDSFKIADLLGSGTGTGCENKRYGTLAVNLAIQCLRILYRDRLDSIEIRGATVPDIGPDSPDYVENVKRRNYFWSRFGFVLEHPDQARTSFRAVLSDLKHLDRGSIASGLSTNLSITEFWRKMNSPRLPKVDVDALMELNVTSAYLRCVPNQEDLHELKRKHWGKIRENYVTVAAVISLGIFYLLCELGLSYTKIATITALLVSSLWLAKNNLMRFFSNHLQNEDIVNQITRKVDDFNEVRKKIDDLSNQHPGILKRLKTAVMATSEKHRDLFASLNESSEYLSYLDKHLFYINWYKAIALFREELKRDINANKQSPYSEKKDFIFHHCYESIDVGSLSKKALELEDQFEIHINRYVQNRPERRLKLHGASYEDPRIILSKLKNIARIEIYSSGNAATYEDNYMQIRVMLLEGFLDFIPTWTIYKDIRASEVINALKPLFDHNLIGKTYITGNGEYIKSPNDLIGLTTAVFDLLNPGLYDDAKTQKLVESQLAIN